MMKSDTVIERYVELLAEESSEPLRQIWCSMADPRLPEGTQFLGAVVVEARGIASATHELNIQGLNLGGEIMFVMIPEGKRVPDEWVNRVMNKEEALSCPAIDVPSNGIAKPSGEPLAAEKVYVCRACSQRWTTQEVNPDPQRPTRFVCADFSCGGVVDRIERG